MSNASPLKKPKDIRHRAVFLVGFASGWRREGLVSLDTSDLSLREDGLLLQLWKSKTDQQGLGLAVLIPYSEDGVTCPVRALEAWLDVRGRWKGPLFTRVANTGGASTYNGK